MPLELCSPASFQHTREVRWGLSASFQGAKGVAQPKPAGPAGWGTRGWAGPEPQRLAGEQGKVEARSWTGQTGVCGGDGTEGGRGQAKRIQLRRLLEAELSQGKQEARL